MPSMANITVKKANGTTDITYTAATPSAGDSSPAVWRENTASGIIGHRPKVQLLIRDNAAKTGRVFQGSYWYPYAVTEATTGKVTLEAMIPVRFEGTLPSNVPDSVLDEAIAQATNIFAGPLFRNALKEQYAPT